MMDKFTIEKRFSKPNKQQKKKHQYVRIRSHIDNRKQSRFPCSFIRTNIDDVFQTWNYTDMKQHYKDIAKKVKTYLNSIFWINNCSRSDCLTFHKV